MDTVHEMVQKGATTTPPQKKEEERKKETYLRPVLPESNARIFTEANVLLNSSLKTELEYNLPYDQLIPREL